MIREFPFRGNFLCPNRSFLCSHRNEPSERFCEPCEITIHRENTEISLIFGRKRLPIVVAIFFVARTFGSSARRLLRYPYLPDSDRKTKWREMLLSSRFSVRTARGACTRTALLALLFPRSVHQLTRQVNKAKLTML